jgi:hydrogenase nickel incorporation protein HypA/HybF
MHELAIAEAVIEIARRHAGDRRVTRVELKVGHLRQVVPSALEFNFELASLGTPVEGAELAMEESRARVACASCGAETERTEFPLVCGDCRSLDVEVVAGDELLVEALELEDELAMREEEVTSGG